MSPPIGVSTKRPAGRTGRAGGSRISRKVTTAAILSGGRSVYPSALSAIVGSSGGIDSVLLWTRFLEPVPCLLHWRKVAHEAKGAGRRWMREHGGETEERGASRASRPACSPANRARRRSSSSRQSLTRDRTEHRSS